MIQASSGRGHANATDQGGGEPRPQNTVRAGTLAPDRPDPAAGRARNLVIVRAGPRSLHPRWTDPDVRPDFDLIVAAYDRNSPRSAGEAERIYIPGKKIAGYAELFRLRPDILRDYEYIGLFDDDLLVAAEDLNRLFAIGRSYRLDLFQPALSWESYFSYAATLRSGSRFRLRYSNVVEMMCPVFSRTHLNEALPLFGLGYELGIDLLWTRLSGQPWFRFAIIDEVTVTHTRPVGSAKDQHVSRLHAGYDDDIASALGRFDATFRGFVPYAAIDRQDRAVLSRPAIALQSLSLWRAWARTPMPKKNFVRFVTDYTRHCMTRPINLGRIGGNGHRGEGMPEQPPRPHCSAPPAGLRAIERAKS